MGAFFSLCRLDGLAIGAIIAVVFADSRLWEVITMRRHWLISATAILAGGMLIETKWGGALGILNYTWFALFYGAVLLIVLIIPSAAAPLRAPPLRFLGDISYGLYLIHLPTLMYFSALFVSPDAHLSSERRLICTFLALGVSVILAYTSARFFEQPVRKAIRKRYIVSSPVWMTSERGSPRRIANASGRPQRTALPFVNGSADIEKNLDLRC
jgi:peptidoglycan/LPS O-acetylase OafA/YrhL